MMILLTKEEYDRLEQRALQLDAVNKNYQVALRADLLAKIRSVIDKHMDGPTLHASPAPRKLLAALNELLVDKH
jgi:hypothetical protein